MTFEDLNLIEPILEALREENYTSPTPIQEKAIPIVLEGNDLLGCAQTGTGKTAAFSIPIIQRLHNSYKPAKRQEIKALVLTPTRELAIQVEENMAAYSRHTPLKHTVIYGGVPQKRQTNILRNGVDILVATPGRLLDLIQQGFISLKHVEYFVLDEADRMLDMGFVHDIKRIIPMLPKKRQTLFFSATMPNTIARLADSMLNQPLKVEVTPVSSTVDTIDQSIYFVDKKDKNALLLDLLQDKGMESILVFARTKHGSNKIVKVLNAANIKAEAIHGNKSQNARQQALSNFKDRTTRVLVATDIAARGIDVDSLSHVINYELPNVPETYVHRIGRTGRAGHTGVAISFCEREELPFLKDIHKVIKKSIPVISDHDYVDEKLEQQVARGEMGGSKAAKPGGRPNSRPAQKGSKPQPGKSFRKPQNKNKPRRDSRN